ncbi:MAG TPA: universal stress protein [Chitinophagaceae bacterium]|nr:universal stress protein [Chitinophagaceae bacterium]
MKNYFTRILVPVLFNDDDAAVTRKATEIANDLSCDIFLLHVQNPSRKIAFVYEEHSSSPADAVVADEIEMYMAGLVDRHRSGMADGLLVEGMVLQGNWPTIMKEVIITHHIDLVIIPGPNKKYFDQLTRQININWLSQQTQCPLLTMTPDFEMSHLQNIVVPVNDFLPVRKLTAASFLARKFNAVVHLVGHQSHSGYDEKRNANCLAMAYQLLSEYAQVNVYCSFTGESIASDTLAYAKSVHAGLIVVNSGKESIRPGWWSRWLGRYLYREATVPVLTIAPSQQ